MCEEKEESEEEGGGGGDSCEFFEFSGAISLNSVLKLKDLRADFQNEIIDKKKN